MTGFKNVIESFASDKDVVSYGTRTTNGGSKMVASFELGNSGYYVLIVSAASDQDDIRGVVLKKNVLLERQILNPLDILTCSSPISLESALKDDVPGAKALVFHMDIFMDKKKVV